MKLTRRSLLAAPAALATPALAQTFPDRPLRLVVPGWEGNLWIKWLRRLEIGDKPWEQREETSRYTDLLANGRARLKTFSFFHAPNSTASTVILFGISSPNKCNESVSAYMNPL